ncbi:hypothetical protein R1flu_026035 [Riccia fluitans]|uniref:Uncharacterized protein n=1 Tax=Riccia fluitans TaxID=41844 RepID=A0ABD1XET4_9MARC
MQEAPTQITSKNKKETDKLVKGKRDKNDDLAVKLYIQLFVVSSLTQDESFSWKQFPLHVQANKLIERKEVASEAGSQGLSDGFQVAQEAKRQLIP